MPDTSFQTDSIAAAEIVLPCPDLDASLKFFVAGLGFQVAAIFPADAPEVAVISGYGLRLRLDTHASGEPASLRLYCHAPDSAAGGVRLLTAPDGTQVEILDADPPLVMPPLRPSLVVTRMDGAAPWHAGRAGLAYRDLIPDRLGGRYIASHIRLSEGGPVPDYVHFHKIGFQMIYCNRGWVKVVYEDQGPPFVMQAGDCVLQPPRIRHRVLESAAGTEVVEIASPASHETLADPQLRLPNARRDAGRDFSGQRFVRHVAARARWQRSGAFEQRDLGIAAATRGHAAARVVRAHGTPGRVDALHQAEFHFMFVLGGSMTLDCDGPQRLAAGDCCVVPAGAPYAIDAGTADLEVLEVLLPGSAAQARA